MSVYTLDDFRQQLKDRGVYKRKRSTPETPRGGERPGRKLGYETPRTFFTRLITAARARIVELEQLCPGEHVPCPRAALSDPPQCLSGCRCGGTSYELAGFLLERYRRIVAEYAHLGVG